MGPGANTDKLKKQPKLEGAPDLYASKESSQLKQVKSEALQRIEEANKKKKAIVYPVIAKR